MGKKGSAQETPIRWSKLEAESFLDIERIEKQLEFRFLIALLAMDMRLLVAFVRVEEEPPPIEEHDSRHDVSVANTTMSERIMEVQK
jgi:hypothetical protein